MRDCWVLALAAGVLACGTLPVAAQTAASGGQPAGPATAPAPAPAPVPKGLWQRDSLLGDMGGLRPALDRYGITLSLSETSEVLGNVTGGVHRGFAYDGLTTMGLQLDTAKAFGWQGGTANISALQLHGRNLSADNLGTLQTASGIESDRATRLWELWYDQAFLGGRFDVKIGQQSIDQEFMFSQYLGAVREHGDGLADGAVGRSLRRRPGLSVVVPGRAASGARQRRGDAARRRVRRQPAWRPVR